MHRQATANAPYAQNFLLYLHNPGPLHLGTVWVGAALSAACHHVRTLKPNLKASTSCDFAAWVPRVLSLALLSSQASYRLMGNCCGGTATVPSEPTPVQLQAQAPQVGQRTTPIPLQPRHSMERPPVSSPQLPRTRSRTTSKPESPHHGGMSSQDPNPRIRTKSAPQRPQSSKSSTQNPRTRAETLSAPKRGSRSDSRPTSPGESWFRTLKIF